MHKSLPEQFKAGEAKTYVSFYNLVLSDKIIMEPKCSSASPTNGPARHLMARDKLLSKNSGFIAEFENLTKGIQLIIWTEFRLRDERILNHLAETRRILHFL